MTEKYDDLIHGAFGDFTEDAESTITAAGSGDVRSKVQRRRKRTRILAGMTVVVLLIVVVAYTIL